MYVVFAFSSCHSLNDSLTVESISGYISLVGICASPEEAEKLRAGWNPYAGKAFVIKEKEKESTTLFRSSHRMSD